MCPMRHARDGLIAAVVWAACVGRSLRGTVPRISVRGGRHVRSCGPCALWRGPLANPSDLGLPKDCQYESEPLCVAVGLWGWAHPSVSKKYTT